MARAIVGLVLLPGCYLAVRGGPSYDFDGDRRGTTVEVMVGAEAHFSPGGIDPSPVGRHGAVFSELGFKAAPVGGESHAGFLYEIGAPRC